MTTHFTLRDFFAYLLNGIVLSFCVSIIFVREIFIVSIDFFDKYEFVNNFSFLLTVFCIPILYVLGHIVGTFSYWLLVFYNWIQKKTLPNWIQKITKGLLYKQRIGYAVEKFVQTDKPNKAFFKIEEFWQVCTKLQIEKVYVPAEYWYILNDFFNSLSMIFFISSFISLVKGDCYLFLLFLFLTFLAFKRAKQYANYFVNTVYRLNIEIVLKDDNKTKYQ